MTGRDASPDSARSTLSNITVHTEKGPAFRDSSTASPPTSTPPTSLGDEASILSDVAKIEHTVETMEEMVGPLALAAAASPAPRSAPDALDSASRRPSRSSRKSVVTYNVQILAGTAIHTPTKYLEKHHTNVLHGPLEAVVKPSPATTPKKRPYHRKAQSTAGNDPAEQQLAAETAQAAQRRTSSRTSAADIRRNLSGVGEVVTNTFLGGKELMKSVLKRSASDSRLRSTTQNASSASLKRRRTIQAAESEDEPEEEDEDEEEVEYAKPKSKNWMEQGLYVGQIRDFDARLSEKENRTRRKSRQAPKERRILPLPMFAAERMLNEDPRHVNRAFKLPYDVYNPLPRKVKVDGWIKISKNRFIGEASALWKRDKQDNSHCYCTPEDGCGEACHNRIMAYECDNGNCPLTEDQCTNRPFAQLKKRAKGNRYDYGVEVMATEGKGYGVRAMRTFEPHQIIVEYAGEIITQEECERRMKQIYKKDKCYYLMSFDNKMIIDATRGTIARFVNHSCEPNCEMIKWTVGGEPRMALFAGRRGIMTGEELTYDYNFDPFSTKNIQQCHCGTRSCRGVLGPKPKKPAPTDESFLSASSQIIAGTKRKLADFFGKNRGSESAPSSPRKRFMANSALTKARNAQAQAEAEREKAAKEATALAAQMLSRENRAMKRGSPSASSKRRQAKATITTSRQTKTTVYNVRNGKFQHKVQHKVTRAGALKKPSTLLRRKPTLAKDKTTKPKPLKTVKKGVPPPKGKPTRLSLQRAATPESESENESPNITPASLRSANRLKPLAPQPKDSSSTERDSMDMSPTPTVTSVASDEEDDADLELAVSNIRGRKRGNAPPPRDMHKTGAKVTKQRHRNERGWYVKGA